MKIDYIENKNGQQIELNKFTVLVGPNNVGKSRTLRDIHEHFTEGDNAKPVILEKLGTSKPETFEGILGDLKIVDHPNHVGMKRIEGVAPKLTKSEQVNFRPDDFQRRFDRGSDLSFIFGNIAKFRLTYLDANSRLNVARKTGSHNPYEDSPNNLLQALYEAEEVEEELRQAFQESFGMDIRLDYSGNQLMLRIADEFEEIPEDPRKAYPILRKYQSLDDQGDGYKSFVGVVLSLLLSRDRVVLLDEPEAFLHPAQSRQLGYWIAEHATEIDGQIIVATHDASFLSGILASSQEVDIHRLNREDDNTTYNLMPPEATENLAKSPLLSSQRILDAIFHRGVIVCEADSDRAVYQTVATKELGNNNFVLVHAHNKQTIPDVVKLLKDASIPVCAIPDLDIVNSPALIELAEILEGDEENIQSELQEIQKTLIDDIQNSENEQILNNLKAEVETFLDQLEQDEHSLSGARGALNRLRRDASDWKTIKIDGIDAFSDEVKPAAERLLEVSKSVGIFIVPVGELEKWMDFGTTRKNKWIVRALEAIHEGNTSKSLIDFVGEIISSFNKDTN